jgi:hypothetical protein
MSNIFSTVRATLIALTIASPVAALAQTPRDLANLVYQQNVPTYVSAAPATSIGQAGAGSATDIARLLRTNSLSGHVSGAPSSTSVFATSFAAQDLARLSSPSSQGLFTIRNNGITVAEGAPN